jgi:hypothetical protein
MRIAKIVLGTVVAVGVLCFAGSVLITDWPSCASNDLVVWLSRIGVTFTFGLLGVAMFGLAVFLIWEEVNKLTGREPPLKLRWPDAVIQEQWGGGRAWPLVAVFTVVFCLAVSTGIAYSTVSTWRDSAAELCKNGDD